MGLWGKIDPVLVNNYEGYSLDSQKEVVSISVSASRLCL